MKVVLLCCGAGTRFDSVHPKPLNLIFGIPMIKYVIDKLSTCANEIIIIYNYILDNYSFKQYLINTFETITFYFICIDFQTRGASESLYLGMKHLDITEQLLVLDNDNIYENLTLTDLPNGNFIIYNNNSTEMTHYSFIQLSDNKNYITDIQERKQISNYICIGGYGFENSDICKAYCKKNILQSDEQEPYLSQAFKLMLKDEITIHAYNLPNAFSIGTPKDVIMNIHKITRKQLKVVFDLDNTIVSYPNKFKDYTTTNTVPTIVNFINYLKEHGHYVIIYTSRRMLTCNNNIGLINKNIAKITIESLDALNIQYDELHFGKPYGDIDIDDKGFNVFDHSLFDEIGFFDFDEKCSNFKCNKYNKIHKINKNKIIKHGQNLEGEIFYYNKISITDLSHFFPQIISYDSNNKIIMEYINGTILYKIYYEGLLQSNLLYKLIDRTDYLHNFNIDDNVVISDDDIYHHYYDKFESRSLVKEDYPFDDLEDVKGVIYLQLLTFLNKKKSFK